MDRRAISAARQSDAALDHVQTRFRRSRRQQESRPQYAGVRTGSRCLQRRSLGLLRHMRDQVAALQKKPLRKPAACLQRGGSLGAEDDPRAVGVFDRSGGAGGNDQAVVRYQLQPGPRRQRLSIPLDHDAFVHLRHPGVNRRAAESLVVDHPGTDQRQQAGGQSHPDKAARGRSAPWFTPLDDGDPCRFRRTDQLADPGHRLRCDIETLDPTEQGGFQVQHRAMNGQCIGLIRQ